MSEPLAEVELARLEHDAGNARDAGPCSPLVVPPRLMIRLIAEVRYMRGLDAAHRRMVSAIKDLASFAAATRRLR